MQYHRPQSDRDRDNIDWFMHLGVEEQVAIGSWTAAIDSGTSSCSDSDMSSDEYTDVMSDLEDEAPSSSSTALKPNDSSAICWDHTTDDDDGMDTSVYDSSSSSADGHSPVSEVESWDWQVAQGQQTVDLWEIPVEIPVDPTPALYIFPIPHESAYLAKPVLAYAVPGPQEPPSQLGPGPGPENVYIAPVLVSAESDQPKVRKAPSPPAKRKPSGSDVCGFCGGGNEPCDKTSDSAAGKIIATGTAEPLLVSAADKRTRKRRRHKDGAVRKDPGMGKWWSGYGYAGDPYCRRCSEVFQPLASV